MRWRIAVHALDRTGPPMLVRALVRWLARAHPDDQVDVLAFRGGAMVGELAAEVPVTVALVDHEPWDHASPDPTRLAELRRRLGALAPVDAMLLVSTSAGQVLPLVEGDSPIVTWSVEMGSDLRWFDGPLRIEERTTRWLAGSPTTLAGLAQHGVPEAEITVVPEFVEAPRPVAAADAAACRAALGAGPGELAVVGAGIGTHRKGMDLFVEVAARLRGHHPRLAFGWIGGADDPLYEPVSHEVARLGLDHVSIRPAVPDLGPWLAAADVLLHSAREDAFPLVCVHAAAAAVPVVAFAGVGGVPDLFGADFVGAPYPDVGGLAEALSALADDAHRASVGERQRRQVQGHLAEAAAPAVRRALVEAVEGAQP